MEKIILFLEITFEFCSCTGLQVCGKSRFNIPKARTRHTKNKSLILCGQNSNPNPKWIHIWDLDVKTKTWRRDSCPIHLYLSFEKLSLKNQVSKIKFQKIKFQKIKFYELDFYCLCSLQKINFEIDFDQKVFIGCPYSVRATYLMCSGMHYTDRTL